MHWEQSAWQDWHAWVTLFLNWLVRQVSVQEELSGCRYLKVWVWSQERQLVASRPLQVRQVTWHSWQSELETLKKCQTVGQVF